MRSLVRESVFKYLFSRLFNQDDEGLFTLLIKDFDDDDKSFANELLKYVLENTETYIEKIEKLSENYKIERVLNTDKCAIIIGMVELDNFKNTPIPVVIDEAVKLSAKYSGERGTDFVNGILAEYVKGKKNV